MYSQQFTLYYCLVKSLLLRVTFIICFCHQLVTLFPMGHPLPPKKNPGSALLPLEIFLNSRDFLYYYVAKSVSMAYLTFWLLTHKKPQL